MNGEKGVKKEVSEVPNAIKAVNAPKAVNGGEAPKAEAPAAPKADKAEAPKADPATAGKRDLNELLNLPENNAAK